MIRSGYPQVIIYKRKTNNNDHQKFNHSFYNDDVYIH
jgi:hypothetical protein